MDIKMPIRTTPAVGTRTVVTILGNLKGTAQMPTTSYTSECRYIILLVSDKAVGVSTELLRPPHYWDIPITETSPPFRGNAVTVVSQSSTPRDHANIEDWSSMSSTSGMNFRIWKLLSVWWSGNIEIHTHDDSGWLLWIVLHIYDEDQSSCFFSREPTPTISSIFSDA